MMPDNDWITVEYLTTLKQESESHATRTLYLQNASRGWKWYKKRLGLVPVDGFDDEEIAPEQATSRDNIIKETVDEVGALLLKNDPIVRRYPHSPSDADLVDDIDRLGLQAWRKARIPGKLASMFREACVGGMSVGKVYWDVHSKSIAMEKIDPQSLFIDPFSSNDNRLLDARYVIHKTRQRIDVVLQRYGKDAEVALGFRDERGRVSTIKPKFSQILARFANMSKELLNRQLTGGSDDNSEEIADPFVDIYEYWIFPIVSSDVNMTTGRETLDDAGYPFGVVVTMIEDRIVKIRPNPYVKNATRITLDANGYPETERIKIGAQRHPFVPFYWDRISDDEGNNRVYNAMGMVEQMIPMQFSIDALRRNVAINARTTANTGGFIDIDALDIPADSITMKPGRFISVKNLRGRIQDAVMINDGAQMPAYVFQMIESDGMKIKARVGLRPGVTGSFPQPGTSHTPALTIGALQEAAFSPLMGHVAELSETIKDISVISDGLMQQFYKVGDYMNVSQQGAERFVEWNQRHVVANFRREVVAAATTAFFDMDRVDRLAGVAATTNEALMSGNPDLIKSQIAYLKNIRYPDAFDWIELLSEKLEEVLQMQQELQQLGALGLAGGGLPEQPLAGGQEELQLPPGGQPAELTGDEMVGLEELEAATGISMEQLMVRLEQD